MAQPRFSPARPLALFAVLFSLAVPQVSAKSLLDAGLGRLFSPKGESRTYVPSRRNLTSGAHYAPVAARTVLTPHAVHDDYLAEISGEGVYQWPKEKFPLKVFIEDSSSVSGYRPEFRALLVDAFNEWVVATNGKAAWQEVQQPSQADLTIKWTNHAPELTGGTEAGRTRLHTAFNPQTNQGVIQRGTMTLVTRLPERELSNAEMKRAYLHEVGHAFGLSGHSSNRTDIMYASISPKMGTVISQRDVNSLIRLYGG